VILPADPVYCRATGSLALLQKSGLINHQYRIIIAKMLDDIVVHHIAQRIGLSAVTAQKGSLPPSTRIARRLGAHPAGLAPLIAEQPIQKQFRFHRRPHLRK
jgi:hypothetical protein